MSKTDQFSAWLMQNDLTVRELQRAARKNGLAFNYKRSGTDIAATKESQKRSHRPDLVAAFISAACTGSVMIGTAFIVSAGVPVFSTIAFAAPTILLNGGGIYACLKNTHSVLRSKAIAHYLPTEKQHDILTRSQEAHGRISPPREQGQKPRYLN